MAEQVRKELKCPRKQAGMGHYFPSRKEFLSVTCLDLQRLIRSSRDERKFCARCGVGQFKV